MKVPDLLEYFLKEEKYMEGGDGAEEPSELFPELRMDGIEREEISSRIEEGLAQLQKRVAAEELSELEVYIPVKNEIKINGLYSFSQKELDELIARDEASNLTLGIFKALKAAIEWSNKSGAKYASVNVLLNIVDDYTIIDTKGRQMLLEAYNIGYLFVDRAISQKEFERIQLVKASLDTIIANYQK